LKTETYPSNRVVSTTYDTVGRPITLNGSYQNQSTGYVTNMTYWANGGINSMTRGNALVHAETYNNRLQLIGVTEKGNNGTLLNLGLTWGASAATNNGLLGTATATGGGISSTQTFGYDILNRLTSAIETNPAQTWQQTYQYDQYGNMWMPPSTPALPAPAIGPGAPTANVYNPLTNRNTNSGYDYAGNLNTFGSQSANFDAENRLLTVGSETYFYDGVGQRVGKTGPSASIIYIYDAFGQLASEYNLSTNPAVPPCATCYVAGDHLGSLRLVTDGSQNANVIARHDFAPFGQEIPAGVGGRSSVWGATDNVSQRFTGQVRDSEVALDFFNARYLSSGLGRFMSADPANAGMDFTNPQSMNGYGYVLGNPLGLLDPSGMGPIGLPPGIHPSAPGKVPGSELGALDPWSGTDLFSLLGLPSGLSWGYTGSEATGPGWMWDFNGDAIFYAEGLYLQPASTPPISALNFAYLNPDGSTTRVQFPRPASTPCSYAGPSNVIFKTGVPAPSAAVGGLMFCVSACMGGTQFRATSTSDSHGPTDPHSLGLAVDFTMPGSAPQIMQCGANCGATYQQNEYANPSPNATGGHYHFQLVPGRRGTVGPFRPQANCGRH